MGFICFILESTVQNKRKLAQVLKVGTWLFKLMHMLWRRALIDLLSMDYSFCLFINTQNHQLKRSSIHSEMDLPTLV